MSTTIRSLLMDAGHYGICRDNATTFRPEEWLNVMPDDFLDAEVNATVERSGDTVVRLVGQDGYETGGDPVLVISPPTFKPTHTVNGEPLMLCKDDYLPLLVSEDGQPLRLLDENEARDIRQEGGTVMWSHGAYTAEEWMRDEFPDTRVTEGGIFWKWDHEHGLERVHAEILP